MIYKGGITFSETCSHKTDRDLRKGKHSKFRHFEQIYLYSFYDFADYINKKNAKTKFKK